MHLAKGTRHATLKVEARCCLVYDAMTLKANREGDDAFITWRILTCCFSGCPA